MFKLTGHLSAHSLINYFNLIASHDLPSEWSPVATKGGQLHK